MKRLTIVKTVLNALLRNDLLELNECDYCEISDITSTEKIRAVIKEVENANICNFYSSVEFDGGRIEWLEAGRNTTIQYICKPYEKAIDIHLQNYDLDLYLISRGNWTELKIHKKGHKSHKIGL